MSMNNFERTQSKVALFRNFELPKLSFGIYCYREIIFNRNALSEAITIFSTTFYSL